MKKKHIIQYFEPDDLLEGKLENINKHFNDLYARYPDAFMYGDEIYSEDSGTYRLAYALCVDKKETPKEKAKRLELQRKKQLECEEKERNLYEKLKSKYEYGITL